MQKENININKVLYYLLFCSFVLLPLDNLPYFGFTGEIGRRGALYPFIIVIPIIIYLLLFKKQRVLRKDDTVSKIIALFYGWTIVSIILNIAPIMDSYFKGRSGVEKLVLQLLVLTFMILVFYCTVYIIELNNLKFKDIRRFILISFLIVSIYCFFEILTLLKIVDFSGFIEAISSIIHSYNRGVFYERGVRGLSGEASYFGMYISFILPWIFSYVFTEKKVKYILLFIYMLVITFFTKSRFAIAIIYIQVILYFMLFIFNMKLKISKKKLIAWFIGIGLVLSMSVNFIYSRGGHDKYGNSATGISITQLIESITSPTNYSNIARMGLMKTAVDMGIDHPIKGVGLGQYAFYANEYVDEYALKSHEVRAWLDPNREEWTPAFSLHLRILAEQGVVGFLIWILLWSYILFSVYKKWKLKDSDDYYGLTLIVSICGVLASGLNADTYVFAPYWILMGLSLLYIRNQNKDINEVK